MKCAHVAEGCRGCKLLHLPYELQLQRKFDFVQTTFGLIGLSSVVEPCVPSPRRSKYRERASFVVDEHGNWGLKGSSPSSVVVRTHDCQVVSPAILQHMQRADLQSGRGKVTCVAVGNKAVSFASAEPLRVPSGVDDLFYYCHPSVFGQANRDVTNLIAANIVSKQAKGRLLELYCGVGSLTIPLSKSFDSILGVEVSELAVRLLKQAAQEQRLNHVDAVARSVEIFLQQEHSFAAETVLVNPPWSGMPIGVRTLLSKNLRDANQLFYLSCNPLTQARDVYHLTKTFG